MKWRTTWFAVGAVTAIILTAGAACHLHPASQGDVHGRESTHSAGSEQPQPTTVDIQGADEWKRAPQMRAFYDETVATFANGTAIDVAAYEARSFAIFREFARANGASEEAMIDHLKLIPRQVVGIVKEDPSVLEDYDSFWAALAGPD
jgi:uncharacterized protein YyaL (SSP411 family)